MNNNFSRALTATLMAVAMNKNKSSRKCIEKRIDDNILNETDRAILKRRKLDGLTYEQLAEEFGYSTSGIIKRIYKAQKLLG